MSPYQRQYDVYQGKGFPGLRVRPAEPFIAMRGAAHVPTNGRKPRPGDALYYDSTAEAFGVPTTIALARSAIGVVGMEPGVTNTVLAAPPAGSNANTRVEYEDGARLQILRLTTVYGIAGGALAFNDPVIWDATNHKWIKRTAATVAAHVDVTANTATAINAALTSVTSRVNAAIGNLGITAFVAQLKSAAADDLVEISIVPWRIS